MSDGHPAYSKRCRRDFAVDIVLDASTHAVVVVDVHIAAGVFLSAEPRVAVFVFVVGVGGDVLSF